MDLETNGIHKIDNLLNRLAPVGLPKCFPFIPIRASTWQDGPLWPPWSVLCTLW